jgi:hypothetical protein
MLLTQRQRGGVERVLPGRTPGARLVAGGELLGMVAEALQQLPDRSRAEMHGAGDVGSGFAAARPPLNDAANGQREWRRHGNPRSVDSGLRILYSSVNARQNLLDSD